MHINDTYYYVKPFIPRRLQISLRRMLVLQKLSSCGEVWPIDQEAAEPPEGWPGWPDGKRFALVLTHDVETGKGQEKCLPVMALEEKLGFRSSVNFVPEEYEVSFAVRNQLTQKGYEVGVHGLTHCGNLFRSKKVFEREARRINNYLRVWKSVGFRAPSMFHNLDWIHDLEIEYDASTFDTDPFEPQPDGVRTIFPFWVSAKTVGKGYVELPYTLPQDFTLFVLMREDGIETWKKKLDWIVKQGGMALILTHSDYMYFGDGRPGCGEYPVKYYEEFLNYIRSTYRGQYWHVLPRDLARHWAATFGQGRAAT